MKTRSRPSGLPRKFLARAVALPVLIGAALCPLPRSRAQSVSTAAAPTYEIAQGKGQATLLLGPANGSSEAAVSRLILRGGAQVPEHVHDKSAEFLYVVSGQITVQLDGQTLTLRPGDAVRIPAGHKHAGSVPPAVERAELVQIYVGPGPEGRFTQGKRLSEGRP